MARNFTEKELYDLLLTQYDSAIAKGFLTSIDDLRSQADVDRLVAAIKSRDIGSALASLHIQETAFEPLAEQIRLGFTDSGSLAVNYMPDILDANGQLAAVVRFSARNPRAEEWLRDKSSELITSIVNDQKVAIRQALVAGLAKGDNPTTTSIDIVGRVDQKTGLRAGGIIGLTAQQEGYVRNARTELESGIVAKLKNYLTRNLRDHRFDGVVDKAIAAEKPVSEDNILAMEKNYRNRLLKMRGDMIGRTESLTALRAGKYEAYNQAIETGGLQGTAIKRIWRSAGDNRVRDSHIEMDGTEVEGMVEPFTSVVSGDQLLFPGDTSLGAGADEVIGCRCDVDYQADFLAAIGKEISNTGGVTFEVAPDPNDKEATAKWNALTPEQKQAISEKVAQQIVPKALNALGATGELINHMGGYQGATNPSMTLRVFEADKVVPAAQVLGYALSQDSMMVISPTEVAHTDQTGMIDVKIGNADPASVYDRLYSTIKNDQGEPMVSGHTTENGLMSIMNDTGLSNEAYAQRIHDALGGEYDIDTRYLYAGFIGKDDYFGEDSTSSSGNSTSGETSIRETSDNLRSEATKDIKDLVDAAE